MEKRIKQTVALQKRMDSLLLEYVRLSVRKCVTTDKIGKDTDLDQAIEVFSLRLLSRHHKKADIPGTTRQKIAFVAKKVDRSTRKDILHEVSLNEPYLMKKGKSRPGQRLGPVNLKKARIKKRDLSRKVGQLRRFFAEKNASRLVITYDHLVKFVTLFIPIAIIAGLVRHSVFSAVFKYNLEVTLTFGDLISSSIRSIVYALIPLAAIVVSYAIRFLEESREIRIVRSKASTGDRVFQALYYLANVAIVVIAYFQGLDRFFGALPIAVLLVSMVILPRVVFRYFKNGFAVFAVLFLLINFYGNIAANTLKDALKIKNGKAEYEYHIVTQGGESIEDECVLITAGSNFYVFWDIERQTTMLLPSDQIASMESTRRKP